MKSRVKRLLRSLYERAFRESDNAALLRAVYRGCLGREPDQSGFAGYMNALRSGSTTWEGVLESVLTSEEFILQFESRGLSARSMHSLHRARMKIYQEYLPPAEHVLDLGGAASNQPEGALFALGYPHAPKELIIVDLPPTERFLGKDSAETQRTLQAARGTAVRYVYASMGDLQSIGDASIDLVVSGESIEHVAEEEADRVCREAFRVLKAGGHFCLDTPNARVTRIQSPDNLIHPEHKKEYYVSELKDKLARSGFQIAAVKGVCPMPATVASRLFDFGEMAQNALLSDDPENCYLFYIHAIKPV